jgi:hypothetical protein
MVSGMFSGLRICNGLNLIERFFNKIKQCQRLATRCDKLAIDHEGFEIGYALISLSPGFGSLPALDRTGGQARHDLALREHRQYQHRQ